MKYSLFWITLLALLPALSFAQNSSSSYDLSQSWFTPELVVSNDDICESFHEEAKEKFLTETSFQRFIRNRRNTSQALLNMSAIDISSLPTVVSIKSDNLNVPYLTIDGKPVYLQWYTHRGCGGACERYQLQTSESQVFGTLGNSPLPSDHASSLFQDQNNSYWLQVLSPDNSRYLLYEVPTDDQWRTACEVRLKPENLEEDNSAEFQLAQDSLDQLRLHVETFIGGGGGAYCGTLDTSYRLTNSLRDDFPELLSRPWAHQDSSVYVDTIAKLRDWSLLGPYEYSVFQDYELSLEQALADLTDFYISTYGWTSAGAETLAYTATTTIISKNLLFSSSMKLFSDEEGQVRRAILAGMPLEGLTSLSFDFTMETNRNGAENIVSLAVDSPELLDYILTNGANANNENAFGKSPLMYAAQLNNLESARLLLGAGADPNAITNKGPDCGYNLSTIQMTPLHYAVRYASPEFIRLLLDNGAMTFITAETYAESTTALDWLQRYTGEEATELNENIPDGSIEELTALLEPQTMAELAEKTMQWILEAEELYQSGNIMAAFKVIALSVLLEPDNERALSDMSLIAIRAGKFGRSLEASKRLIDSEVNERVKASAWFNYGLACQQAGSSFRFNREFFCTTGTLDPYQQALQLMPTNARENTILEFFANDEVPYCQIPDEGGGIKLNFSRGTQQEGGEMRTVSILHDRGSELPELDLWVSRFLSENVRNIDIEKITEWDVGEKTLTLLKTGYIPFPLNVDGYVCTTASETTDAIPIEEYTSRRR